MSTITQSLLARESVLATVQEVDFEGNTSCLLFKVDDFHNQQTSHALCDSAETGNSSQKLIICMYDPRGPIVP